MPTQYHHVRNQLSANPVRWVVTGVAGFIGSNVLEELLLLGQTVVGVDNFSTGYRQNLEDVHRSVGEKAWKNFQFLEGDVNEAELCKKACADSTYVLHQGALGSVPRSIEDPIATNRSNVSGFLQILHSAKDAGVKKFVYASSSSVYGDSPKLPKHEADIGNALSPYAVSKRVNELYADVFAQCYGLSSVGLRYFNVFGPRQDPRGAYAAVIPLWIDSLVSGRPCVINGDGETTRDFCYVANVVQANILSAIAPVNSASHRVYNIAVGEQTSLKALHEILAEEVRNITGKPTMSAQYREFRKGDIRDSLADISGAETELGYEPSHRAREGFGLTVKWFAAHVKT